MVRVAQLTFVVALIALAAAAGYTVGAGSVPPPPDCPPPPPPPACPDPGSSTDRLAAAQTQLDSLSLALAAKEAELQSAQAEAAQAGAAKAAAADRAKRLEAEVGGLKKQIGEVKAERDRLVTELKDTLQKLGEQVVLTEQVSAERDSWKSRSTDERWGRFVAEAKTAMCDKGTVKRHDACYAAVDGALGEALRRQFQACVSSGQAVPTLGQVEKGKQPPAQAVTLPDSKEYSSKGWYVLMCDPSLPEATPPGTP